MAANKGSGFCTGFVLGGIVGAGIVFFLSRKGGFIEQAMKNVQEAIAEGKEAAARREADLRGELDR